MEAVFAYIRIDEHLLYLCEVILLADNSDVYHIVLIALLEPTVYSRNILKLNRYIDIKTDDGKSQLDCHFGSSGNRIISWIQSGNDMCTQKKYYEALKEGYSI